MKKRAIPVGGIALVLVTSAIVVAAGGDAWLTLGMALVWTASLWLGAAPPAPASAGQGRGVQLTLTGMRDLIEHSGLPMLVVQNERIIIANQAARQALGDHIVGQDPRVAFRHPAAVDLLCRTGSGGATIEGLTGPRSSWQMNRQSIDERFTLIELIDRTAEADASRAHTDFVANASHELRTPLASIIGYMETLTDAEEPVEPSFAAKFQTTVLREARRLQSLVDDLMSLSRVEAEKHDQPRAPVNIAQLIPQAARDGAGAERHERLELELPEEPVFVRGDRQQLEQLARNLIDNAFKYGDPLTPVTISLAPDVSGMAVLRVRDRGEGIAPEHVPHLTRRFYRTDPGRSRAAGGTGLGLAIVKHIVERHRGRLDIHSERGVGTVVSVRLPLADEPGADASE